MKIELKNIGTVKQAEIDLDKNLLVFCGPNNSGKTYVAYTLYGVYKTTKYSMNTGVAADTETNDNEYLTFTLSPQLVRAILSERASTVRDDLGYIFASNLYFFVNAEISIDSELTDAEINEKVNNLIIEDNHQSLFGSTYAIHKRGNTNFISIKGISTFPEKADKKRIEFENNLNCNFIVKGLITNLFFGNAYIAPAERVAINIFSKELSLNRSGLLDPPFKIESNVKSRYSLPITSCLRVAEDLSYLQKTQSNYSFLAELIEQKILGGNIDVSSNGDMQFNPSGADIKGLDIHLSASMVKSLSSLVFYFRHLAEKEDFIIIDEPELNLHPDNQIIMARILARIVNAGFKVLISTHSDYIIKELNNLVRLDSKKEEAKEIMDRYGYEKEDLLAKDALGVYLFKDNTATNLEVDELGFDVSTIEKVNSELAQISESIYFDLLDQDAE